MAEPTADTLSAIWVLLKKIEKEQHRQARDLEQIYRLVNR